MLFSEPAFLFFFLPGVLAVYFLPWKKHRNVWLLVTSLFFYAWGEKVMTLIMLFSIVLNYGMGVWIERTLGTSACRWILGVAVALNLLLLGIFKYANFTVHTLNGILGLADLPSIHLRHIALPIGISFFTFHAISYIVDIYRRVSPAQHNPFDMALYITFFPQLIAGPIIRYHDVDEQIRHRSVTQSDFAYGVRRFVFGLSKKMILANTLAAPADRIFTLPTEQLHMGLAWLGVICYMLQIYFDFSGYSDMAIGLARLFGFRFRENFSYPYVAQSVTDFWHRWHISLSTWFRDYLYIPLGGNRRGLKRTYLNLITVFFLCGLWHGASWTFVVWGLYHGAFLALERAGFSRLLDRLAVPLRHVYLLLVVLIGWVFFRCDTFAGAIGYLETMFGLQHGSALAYPSALLVDRRLVLALAGAALASTPVLPALVRLLAGPASEPERPTRGARIGLIVAEPVVLAALFILCSMLMAAGTYNPFIYFRF